MAEGAAKEPKRKIKVRVKRELGERVGFAAPGASAERGLWAKDHYCWQVALINQVVQPPWSRCFGSLGTGFVGVRPDVPASSASRKPKPPAAGAGSPESESAPGSGDSPSVPLDATIIIFVNAPAAALQTRGGRMIDGYKDALDRSQRTLEWSAQRSDKNNKRIEAIIGHRRSGGRVVVGVRSPAKRQFRLLGEVSDIDELQKARFLVEYGDHVIQERGTRTFHKVITAACLNNGLRSGVGLTAARYPLKCAARWCMCCCYAPPKALLHFKELEDDGVAAFQTPAGWELKRERIVKPKLEADGVVPTKRLRCKTNPDEMTIKTEKEEKEALQAKGEVSKPFREAAAKLELPDPGPDTSSTAGLISVKLELPEDPPEDMSPSGYGDDSFL